MEFERGKKGAEAGNLGCCREMGSPRSKRENLEVGRSFSELEVRKAAGSLENLQTAARGRCPSKQV